MCEGCAPSGSSLSVADGEGQDQVSGTVRPVRYIWIWLTLVIVLGAALRWTQVEWAQGYCFNMQGDGLLAWARAVDYARGEASSQYLGQPQYNRYSHLPGPLWAQFCLVGMRLTGSPEGIMILIALVNTAVIGLAFLLVHQACGQRTALWAALLMATFPRAILFSAGVYNPNVMACLGAVFFLALWRVVRNDRSRAVFWVALIPLISLQFHMSGLMLLLTAIVLLVLTAARCHWRWMLAGVLVAVLSYVPYLQGELATHWQNSRGMIHGGSSHHTVGALKVLLSSAGYLVNWSPGWIRDNHEYLELARYGFGHPVVLLALYGLSTVLAALMFRSVWIVVREDLKTFTWSTRRAFFARSGRAVLASMFLVPVLVSLLEGRGFHARYALAFLVPIYGVAAIGLSRLVEASRRRNEVRWLVVLVLLSNVWIVLATNLYLGEQIRQGREFRASFHKLESVYQALLAKVGEDRRVRIDDAAFQQGCSPDDPSTQDALLVRTYVEVREQERGKRVQADRPEALFSLNPAAGINPATPGVAYCGNGIALIAVQSR